MFMDEQFIILAMELNYLSLLLLLLLRILNNSNNLPLFA